MQVDCVMWVLNGERTLKAVLNRINLVIPKDCVGQKIVVDDGSIDGSREIAVSCGWRVVKNFGKGISAGANTALKLVESEFFCSFEQDVLISRDWWVKVALPTLKAGYAVGSGVRFNSVPYGVANLIKYTNGRCCSEVNSRKGFGLGKTLDNTIYNTGVLRSLGGFPVFGVNAGIDLILAWLIAKKGFVWHVFFNVVSVHLRSGLFDELKHQYWYGTQHSVINSELKKLGVCIEVSKFSLVSHLFFPPFHGLIAALKTGDATICYIYPLIRFYYVWGVLKEVRRV